MKKTITIVLSGLLLVALLAITAQSANASNLGIQGQITLSDDPNVPADPNADPNDGGSYSDATE